MQSFTNSFVNLFHCFRPPRARDPLPQCHDGHNRYAIGNDTLSADETFVGFTADANNLLAVEVVSVRQLSEQLAWGSNE